MLSRWDQLVSELDLPLPKPNQLGPFEVLELDHGLNCRFRGCGDKSISVRILQHAATRPVDLSESEYFSIASRFVLKPLISVAGPIKTAKDVMAKPDFAESAKLATLALQHVSKNVIGLITLEMGLSIEILYESLSRALRTL